ncbi:MAG TPA: NUDIX domain-containing protein [Rhodopila sp.]
MNDKNPMLARKMRRGIQFGVIPFVMTPDGSIRIVLLTSRGTRRWVIPKGWPKRRLKPYEAAAEEAFEEAGLSGAIVGKHPIGAYAYSKEISPSLSIPCAVKVFLLQVEVQAETWLEQHERSIQWCDPRTAATLVAEPELSSLLRTLPALVQRRRKSLSKRQLSLSGLGQSLREVPILSGEMQVVSDE